MPWFCAIGCVGARYHPGVTEIPDTSYELADRLSATAQLALESCIAKDIEKTRHCLAVLGSYDGPHRPVLPGAMLCWIDSLVEHMTALPAPLGRKVIRPGSSSSLTDAATGERFASGSAAFDMELEMAPQVAVQIIDAAIDEDADKFWRLINMGHSAKDYVDVVFAVLQIVATTLEKEKRGFGYRGQP